MKTVAFAFAAAAFMAAAAPAHAQISENGGPVSYSADNLQYFDGDRRLVLTGNVDMGAGTNVFTAMSGAAFPTGTCLLYTSPSPRDRG